ncbi:MAG: M1 family metallopeptidase [Candidatus Helarchaeota archaeon]
MDNILPTNYFIHLEPNLETFEFFGRIEISLTIQNPTREIAINAVDLKVNFCKILTNNDEYKDVSFSEDTDSESLIINLPSKKCGEIKILIEYIGKIRDDMRGFYRSRYTKNDEEKFMAITQFEETEARRCFPCFDHPRYKATFNIEMIIDKDLEALSNASKAEEKILEDGRKLIRFHKTVKMSTYLVFFGVGEYEFVEDPGDVLVRVVTPPGKKQYADVGLKFARKSMTWLENYYGIKFPLQKIDHIAVADFAFGAMENWGAITYRENLILYYPGKTSQAALERMYEVISHELAHQWFGNLVSPDDWRYLWLNESFASLFGYAVSASYFPEWGIWENFVIDMTTLAYARDSLIDTIPIELPGGEISRITRYTVHILYDKGASVLRMLENYLGDKFREGIHHYLKKYEYSTASSNDLWASLEEVTKEPISNMMKSWIQQPGYPMVEITRKNNKLQIKQARFTYLPLVSSQKWIIPIKIWVLYSNGESKIIKRLIHNEIEEIELSGEIIAYKINFGQTGFYQVKYNDDNNLNALGKLILSKKLPPLDRWGLENDIFSLLQKGELPISKYFEFLENFKDEETPLPLESIVVHLYHLYNLTKDSLREKIKETGRKICENVLRKIGYEPKSGELHNISSLRSIIIWVGAVFGSQETIEFALNQFAKLKDNKPIHEDIMAAVMRTVAYEENEACDWLIKKFEKIDNEPERINVAIALGSVKKDYMKKALQFALEKIPPRIKFYPIIYIIRNPSTRPLIWDWFVENIKELENFHPNHYQTIIDELITIGGIGREDEIKAFFKSYETKDKTLQDVINMSLEKLKINSNFEKMLNL